jgi:hypothetical protein
MKAHYSFMGVDSIVGKPFRPQPQRRGRPLRRASNLMPTCIAGRHGSLPLQDLTYVQNAGKRQFKNSGVGLAALKLN